MTMGIQQLMWAMEKACDAFHAAVYVDRDVAAATAVFRDPHVLANTPAGTGAEGEAELRRHLAEDVLPHLPADLTFTRVSRTADQRRVVDEATVAFTHDRELPWLLPGVEPTGRPAEVQAISIVAFKHHSSMGRTSSLITSHRTLWDHVALLEQLDVDLRAGGSRGRSAWTGSRA